MSYTQLKVIMKRENLPRNVEVQNAVFTEGVLACNQCIYIYRYISYCSKLPIMKSNLRMEANTIREKTLWAVLRPHMHIRR